MITLTPEQSRVLEQAGAGPVLVVDPTGCRTYRLVEVDATARDIATGELGPPRYDDIPEGILRSQAAFLRDLPELLKDESLRGLRVIDHGDERIGIAPKKQPLIEECARRGLKRDEYDVFAIEETEAVDCPSSWIS